MPQFYKTSDPTNVINIEEADAIKFQGGKAGDPFGGLLRSGYTQGAPPSTTPSPITEPPNPVTSSTNIRREQDLNRANAAGVMDGLAGLDQQTIDELTKQVLGQTAQSPDSTNLLQELNDMRKSLGMLSASEEQEVLAAGQQAALKFAPLITEAQEERRKGLPKALVGAGQRGGLMSSQFAGAAAGQPIVGETFFGAGGKLEDIKSVYDRNISNLRAQQEQAVMAAEALAKKAIRTGKREDLDLLTKAYDRAQTAHQESQKLQREKLDVILGLQDRAVTQQKQGLDIIQQQLDIASDIPAGETRIFTDPITGEEIEFTGIGTEDVDPFFTGANIVSLMKTIPEGETRTITDPNTGRTFSLQGFSQTKPNEKTIQATDDAGNVTITTIDLNTGEVKNQVSAGRVGKTKAAPVSIVLNQQQSDALASARQRLEASVGQDGKANTEVFLNERKDYIQRTGDAKAFDESFKDLLSNQPGDTKAQELRERLDLPTTDDQGSWTPDQEQAFLNLGIDQGIIDTAKAIGLTPDELLD